MSKTKITLIAFAAFALIVFTGAKIGDGLPQYYTVFNGDTFDDDATTTDTSGWLQLYGASEVDYTGFYTGSASSTMTIYVLGKFGSSTKLVYSGAAHTTSGLLNVRLRMADSNKIATPSMIKIATTIIGAGDSSALNKFYGYMELR